MHRGSQRILYNSVYLRVFSVPLCVPCCSLFLVLARPSSQSSYEFPEFPQILMKTPPPSPEQFLAAYPDELQTLAHALRQVVKTALPEVQEAVYPGWKLIGYRVPRGKKTVYVGFVAPQPGRVVLGFEYGYLLSDPDGLLTSGGNQVRVVAFVAGDVVRPQLLIPLIQQAAHIARLSREQKQALFLQRQVEGMQEVASR